MSATATSAEHRIPSEITLTQLREACKPLLDLLGVDENETNLPIVIGRHDISFSVTARRKSDPAPIPAGSSAIAELDRSPVEFAELAWPATVAVDINR